ncbi:MAG: hypothetical protein EOM25_01400 [Deltaproteobacteria bacterium]|nr:hypothetical protein [Deltaproteobacteria bacterium]
MDRTDPALLSRVASCVEAILELEARLGLSGQDSETATEFKYLRRLAPRIASMAMAESDVERIEEATARFFDELRKVFGDVPLGPLRILH